MKTEDLRKKFDKECTSKGLNYIFNFFLPYLKEEIACSCPEGLHTKNNCIGYAVGVTSDKCSNNIIIGEDISKKELKEEVSGVYRKPKKDISFGEHLKKMMPTYGLGEEDDIKVGDNVIVMGELKTKITKIEGDKYYFNDENGKEWQELISGIKKEKQEMEPANSIHRLEVSKFVQKWMASHEPDTFIKSNDEHERYWYKSECGRSGINLEYFFESLLEDYIDEKKEESKPEWSNKDKSEILDRADEWNKAFGEEIKAITDQEIRNESKNRNGHPTRGEQTYWELGARWMRDKQLSNNQDECIAFAEWMENKYLRSSFSDNWFSVTQDPMSTFPITSNQLYSLFKEQTK